MALQYVPFFKKRVCIKRMLQSDTLKNPDFAMSAKEQLLRGVLGCLVNKEKRKGKGKKNLREGRTCSESSPSLKGFYCYQLIVVLSNGRAEQSVFLFEGGSGQRHIALLFGEGRARCPLIGSLYSSSLSSRPATTRKASRACAAISWLARPRPSQ